MSEYQPPVTPTDETQLAIAGDVDDPLVIPRGLHSNPISETEQQAAQDTDARELPKGVWDSVIKRLEGRRGISAEYIQNVTSLPIEDAEAIFKGLQARNMLETVTPPKKFLRRREVGYVALRKQVEPVREEPENGWGVIIVDHPLNGADKKRDGAVVYFPRPSKHKRQRQSRQSQPVPDQKESDPQQRSKAERDAEEYKKSQKRPPHDH